MRRARRTNAPEDAGFISSEQLAYWFLRLNGCLTIINFILHPDRSGAQRTDADLVGVRFPYRAELADTENPLIDHPAFRASDRIDVVIAEVKGPRDYCRINGPWTDPRRGNLGYLLQALGLFSKSASADVENALYEKYRYRDDQYDLRLFALGGARNEELPGEVVQMTWAEDVLPFVYGRFAQHARQKSQNDQWDETGRALFRCVTSSNDETDFIQRVLGRLV